MTDHRLPSKHNRAYLGVIVRSGRPDYEPYSGHRTATDRTMTRKYLLICGFTLRSADRSMTARHRAQGCRSIDRQPAQPL